MRAEAQRRDRTVKDAHSHLFTDHASWNIPGPTTPTLPSFWVCRTKAQTEGHYTHGLYSDPQWPRLEIGDH